jgi:hypothetical protein
VATWEDEGSGGNDLTQGTAGLRPVYKASAGVNGNPSVLFASDAMATGTYAAAETQPNTIVFVVEWVSATDDGYLCDGLDGGRHALWWNTGGDQHQGYAGNVVGLGAEPTADVAVLLTAVFNGSATTLHSDETLLSGSVNIGNEDLTGFTLGNRFSQGQTVSMYVAEVLIYDRVLDSEELADLGAYVQQTYGIDLGYDTGITPADASHAHTADQVTLTQRTTVADASHAHTADQVTLTQKHVIAPADALHAHTADQVTFPSEGGRTDLWDWLWYMERIGAL